ncbi:hypothetical protein GCM10027514_15970 [Azotobacter armeniacus]
MVVKANVYGHDGREVMTALRAPLAGRVSMDVLTVDLGELPEARVGDAVELWGAGLPVDEVARACGTIGYELLTRMTARVPRRYRFQTLPAGLSPAYNRLFHSAFCSFFVLYCAPFAIPRRSPPCTQPSRSSTIPSTGPNASDRHPSCR